MDQCQATIYGRDTCNRRQCKRHAVSGRYCSLHARMMSSGTADCGDLDQLLRHEIENNGPILLWVGEDFPREKCGFRGLNLNRGRVSLSNWLGMAPIAPRVAAAVKACAEDRRFIPTVLSDVSKASA